MRRSLLSILRSQLLASMALWFLLPSSHAAGIKTDLDADINRDGVVDNDDPEDNGKVQNRPPGLRIAQGSLERLVLRCEPKTLDRGYVRLTVVSHPGEWVLLEDPGRAAVPRRPEGGHVRVWKDADKRELLLDSHDPAKQTVVWRLSYDFPMVLVPDTLYAEGVAASKEAGDIVFVLLHSATPSVRATSPTRDVLVTTVGPPEKAPLARAASRDDPPARGGGTAAEQLAIWTFEDSPVFANSNGVGLPLAATAEDVAGSPTFTMLNADIDANGKNGTAYTDVEGVPRPDPANAPTDQAAAWNDIRKSNAPDAEFRVAIATTGWKDIWFRFDYKSDSTTTFRLQYSLDGGVQWGNAFPSTVPITADKFTNWHALPGQDLSGLDAIENVPAVLFRFYDFRQFGNDKLAFDNLEFYGTRLPPPNAPTIRVAPSTTAFLSLESANEGYVSGVIADPTDPPRLMGIDFVVGDPNTPLAQLVVNAAAPTDRVALALTGGDANWNLTIAPLVVGYTDIDITASDGTDTTTYRIRYAASAAAADPMGPRFHTGVSDASAATAVDAATILVANDEDRSIWLFHRDASGLYRTQFDTAPWLGLGSERETDVEGCARDGDLAYWIGSHGNNTDGTDRLDRHRLFATTISGTGEQTTLDYVGRYDNLRTDLVNWDAANLHGKGADYYGIAASVAGLEPKRDDGFNIEGLAMGPSSRTVYVGFRAPIVPANNRTKALVVPITNVQALVSADPSPGPAIFGPPIELDLGGRGIRSFARTARGSYLIVAGPTTNATGIPPSDFRLYAWSGQASEQPSLLDTDLAGLAAPGSFEAIVELPGGVAATVQLLSDCGTADWYGDAKESKTLNSNWQKFRSDWVGTGTGSGAFGFTLGGAQQDTAWSVASTRDGGSILLGCTSSAGAGKQDLWLCKTSDDGSIEWQKTYGGSEDDGGMQGDMFFERPCVRQTLDGEFLVVGTTWSFGAGAADMWVLRLAADGDIVWQKTFGGPASDFGTAAAICADGTLVVGGTTRSFSAEETDAWVLRLRPDGSILWQTAYNSIAAESDRRAPSLESVRGIEEEPGGDLLVTGNSRDAPMLMRIAPNGDLRWPIEYGDSADARANCAVKHTADGGCVVASGDSCCVQKIDGTGRTVWCRTYMPVHQSGPKEAWLLHAWAIDETPDGGYIVGTLAIRPILGPTNSIFPALLRIDGNGMPLWARSYWRVDRTDEVRGFPPESGDYMRERFVSLSARADGSCMVCGKSAMTSASTRDMLLLRVAPDGTLPGYTTELLEVGAAGPPPRCAGSISIAGRATNAIGSTTSVAPVDTDLSPGRSLP